MTIAFPFRRRRMLGQRLLRWSHGLLAMTLLHQLSLVGVAKAQERSAPDTVDEKRTSTAGMDRMTPGVPACGTLGIRTEPLH
jgi:hypothetical protein